MAKLSRRTIKVETETAPTPEGVKQNDYRGDPMWNTRRRGMTYVLVFCAGYLLLLTGLAAFANMGADKISALGGVVAAIGVIASPILVAWFVVAEYGRVNGVLGTSVTTQTSVKP